MGKKVVKLYLLAIIMSLWLCSTVFYGLGNPQIYIEEELKILLDPGLNHPATFQPITGDNLATTDTDFTYVKPLDVQTLKKIQQLPVIYVVK
jgi:hypothetical protein